LVTSTASVIREMKMTILFKQTADHYKHLGEWVAQIKGLPQARHYGATLPEAVGKLVLTFGKDQGMTINPPNEKVWERENSCIC